MTLLHFSFSSTLTIRTGPQKRAVGLVAGALALLGFASGACAQSQTSKKATAKTGAVATSPAETELQTRLAAAQTAKQSGDPAAIEQANEHLIALALREMAHLRLVEAVYPQAIELYRQSLGFENLADSRVDLAIAALGANRLDEALAESGKALLGAPDNARAYGVRGRAWIGKEEYAKAAGDLAESAKRNPDLETSYLEGICLLRTRSERDRKLAEAAFAEIVRVNGDSGSLHVLFGRAYRDADDMPTAIREFRRAVELDTRTPHAHYFLGLAQLAVNEWKSTPEVKTEFAKELEFYPRDYLANYMTGFLASGDRDYATSTKYLKIATDVNPNWPEPWLYLGLNAYSQNDAKRAEECFRRAITLTGTDEARSNYQIRRAYVSLGRILANSGRADESQTYLAKARELQNKTMEQSQQNIASMVEASGGAGTGAAIVPLNKARESEAAPLVTADADPFARLDATTFAGTNLTEKQKAYAEAQENRLRTVLGLSYNDLATSKAVRKLYQAALGDYQEAERWDPKLPGLQKNLGLSAFKLGNYPEAIRGLSAELQANPEAPSVRAILGMAYFGSDKFSSAAATFAPLGEPGMRDPTVGYAWASSLAKLNELDRATKVLKTFAAGALPNDVLLLVGQLWIEIGDYARAVAALDRILQADEHFPKAHYFAGKAYLRWEHFDEAAKELNAELALVPEDTDAKYTLGFVYLKQRKSGEAEELFRQVIALEPGQVNAQYELGKMLLDRGKLPEATAHLEVAARLSPETDYVHYQLQAAYRKGARTEDADRELEIYKRIKAKARDRAVPPGDSH